MWWPWGNGETVSIRVGHFIADQPELENEESIKGYYMKVPSMKAVGVEIDSD